MSNHAITPAVLKEMAKESNITFLPGDILLVRTGWIKWYEEHSMEDRRKSITNGSAWVGVQGSEETLEFLWNGRFAAVAGDSIGWEVWPPQQDEYSKSLLRVLHLASGN
jgi:kynurenine formamidase